MCTVGYDKKLDSGKIIAPFPPTFSILLLLVHALLL